MNQIMQKQRSPYTGGGFNVQQLKSSNFGKAEGLNGMPFLVQLAKQAQRPMTRVGSPPPQPFSVGGTAAGHERGLRSGTPRSYANTEGSNNMNNVNNICNNNNMCNNNNNNCFEGDIPTLPSLGHNDDYSHNYHHMDAPLDQLDGLAQLGHLGALGQMGQLGHLDAMPQHQMLGDTDSESEYCQHMKDFGGSCTGKVYWRRAFDCLKSRMPPQRQERMEMTLRHCRAHSVFGHVLLLLQLMRILLVGALLQGLRLSINFGQTSYRLWRCKFQLRSIVRQFLWRMANAKGNDVFLFLGIMLITPWLFLISLIGFIVATLFHVKTGLGASWRQMRLQVLR